MTTITLQLDTRRLIFAVLAGISLCAGAALSLPALAADEDTQASVYLVFDPETGEFVTVHDTEGQAKAQETREAIESVADAGEGAASVAGSAGAASSAPDATAQSKTSPALLAGLVVAAIAVIGGAVMMMRRS